MKTILFVCVHNAGRSQMAEAFFNQMAKGKAGATGRSGAGERRSPLQVKAISAGTQPADKVNPVVVEAMKEVGIDISKNKPKALTAAMVEKADRMITMGCGDDAAGLCPAKIIETEDWALDDPHGQPIEKVREIRDEVKERVAGLLGEMG